MRISARLFFVTFFSLSTIFLFKLPIQAAAQSLNQQSSTPIAPTTVINTNTSNFLTPNVEANVPKNHHEYTQIMLIDLFSTIMCQLSGVDPTNPQQPCLGVNMTTGQIGMIPSSPSLQFGQAQNTQPKVGGAVKLMAGYISSLYIPAVSTSDYTDYLASNFGIVKHAYAAGPANCAANTFGYGFCGLSPIFTLWTGMRDLAYTLLIILFVVIGIGVMLRFHVDPRTVMTLQNQIPRVIIAIALITFSYAIAGAMIDMMWTVTYAGINFISQSSTSKITLCPNTKPLPLSQGVEQRLIDTPLSFVNTIFRYDPGCKDTNNGLFTLSQKVSTSLGDLVQQVVSDVLNLQGNGCGFTLNPLTIAGCIATSAFGKAMLWLDEQIISLVILIILLVSLFRLWFQLIKTYLTFIIFVILGPVWIVLGLIPGRPMGFEKWLRIIFTNLAIFPLVAFILVFARVIVDAVPKLDPQTVFIPPLVGNPNISTFASFMGLGAILIAPSIPDLIRERMKAKGQTNYGAIAAAGIGAGAAVATSPGKKIWEGLNRRNPTTGEPEGAMAVARQRLWQKTPYFGRRAIARKQILRESQHSGGGDLTNLGGKVRQRMKELANPEKVATTEQGQRAQQLHHEGQQAAAQNPSRFRKIIGRGQSPQAPQQPTTQPQPPQEGSSGTQGNGGQGDQNNS
ncbi:MAG TPA: hypothetical protein VNW29_05180 [Candidatus Sulfotelmatobacter sp.]|jgi:hypothetical protein|nr:hypothetical protein [Candidatus Sulfotelmatobacter sp.]